MAKLILETEYGMRVIRDDLPESVKIDDILYAGDYIAKKLWNCKDVDRALKDLGYEANNDIVDNVINSGMVESLNDCTDADWEVIYNAIEYAIQNMKTYCK